MEIPPNIQKILDKSKIFEKVESPHDVTFWLKNPEEYEMPDKINQIAENWEMHICKRGPFLLRFLK